MPTDPVRIELTVAPNPPPTFVPAAPASVSVPPENVYPATLKVRSVTLTGPAVLSTVTVPAATPNTAASPAVGQGTLADPSNQLSTAGSTVQTPVPPCGAGACAGFGSQSSAAGGQGADRQGDRRGRRGGQAEARIAGRRGGPVRRTRSSRRNAAFDFLIAKMSPPTNTSLVSAALPRHRINTPVREHSTKAALPCCRVTACRTVLAPKRKTRGGCGILCGGRRAWVQRAGAHAACAPTYETRTPQTATAPRRAHGPSRGRSGAGRPGGPSRPAGAVARRACSAHLPEARTRQAGSLLGGRLLGRRRLGVGRLGGLPRSYVACVDLRRPSGRPPAASSSRPACTSATGSSPCFSTASRATSLAASASSALPKKLAARTASSATRGSLSWACFFSRSSTPGTRSRQ